MKFNLIRDGNIAGPYRLTLFIAGILLMVLPVEFMEPSWLSRALFLVGLFVLAIGGFAARAHTLGLKPFDDSYKKARESYKRNEKGGDSEP